MKYGRIGVALVVWLCVQAAVVTPLAAQAAPIPLWDNGGTHAHGTISPLSPIILGTLASSRYAGSLPATHPAGSSGGSADVKIATLGATDSEGLGPLVGPMAGPLQPALLTDFGGLAPGGSPSDSQVAAGGGEVVEVINVTGAVFSRGGVNLHTFSLATFSSFAAVTDPRVAFDQKRGHFMISVMELTPGAGGNRVMVGVSANTNPLGTWFRYIVYTAPSAECADQPKLGYSADKIVITANQANTVCIRSSSVPFDADHMIVLDATAMRLGNPAAFDDFNMDTLTNHRFGLIPALPAPTAQGTSNAFVVYHGSDLLNSDIASLIVVKGNPSSTVTPTLFQEQSNGIDGMTDPSPAAQPAGFPSINADPGARQILSAVLIANIGSFGGRLLMVSSEACIPKGDTTQHDCIRFVDSEMDATASTSTKLADVSLGIPGEDVIYPAITQDASGDRLLTYTRTSSSHGPIEEVASLELTGTSAFGRGRTVLRSFAPSSDPIWGDYSGMAPDDFDPRGVWAVPSSTVGSGTGVGLVTLGSPVVTNVTPNHGVSGTSVIILGGRFPSNAVVMFGTEAAPSVTWNGPEMLQAIAPPNPGGPVDVRVAGAKGLSAVVPVDVYTYPLIAWASTPADDAAQAYDVSTPGIPLLAGSPVVTGLQPQAIAVTPDASRVVVGNLGDSTITVIQTLTMTATAVPVPGPPVDMVLTADSRDAWVATSNNLLFELDLVGTTVVPGTLTPLPATPEGIALSDSGQFLFVTMPAFNDLSIYQILAGVPAFFSDTHNFLNPTRIAAGRGMVWFTYGLAPAPSQVISMQDSLPFLVGSPLDVGVNPGDVAVTPAGDYIGVTNSDSGTLSIVHHTGGTGLGGDSRLPDYPIATGAMGLVSSPAGDRFFIANTGLAALLDAGPPGGITTVGQVFTTLAPPFDVAVATPLPRACTGISPTPKFQGVAVGANPGNAVHGSTVVLVMRALWCFAQGITNAKMRISLMPPALSGCPTFTVTISGLTLNAGDNTLLQSLSAPSCAATYSVTVAIGDPTSKAVGGATTTLVVT